jgi:uncharacterized protein YndB with AHSA1/START domain
MTTGNERRESTMTETQSTAIREATITRVFDAPRERVWQCLTEPEHLTRI